MKGGGKMVTSGCSEKSYVMFENAGVADFNALFFVGYTDKAGRPDTIGQFGSGFKLGLTSALRLGIDVTVYLGREKVKAGTVRRKVKGDDVEQLVFHREGPEGMVETRETNLTLGYGARDWKDEWGVFREMLQNAFDADPRGYEVVYGVAPKGRDGFTRVFLEATEGILAIYRDLDSFFRDPRDAMFVCDQGRVYPKSARTDRRTTTAKACTYSQPRKPAFTTSTSTNCPSTRAAMRAQAASLTTFSGCSTFVRRT